MQIAHNYTCDLVSILSGKNIQCLWSGKTVQQHLVYFSAIRNNAEKTVPILQTPCYNEKGVFVACCFISANKAGKIPELQNSVTEILAENLRKRGDFMVKKEMIAMLLAGGQGSRLGVLTSKLAKPAVAFGGKYKIIDFPLSNCINSGVDTVGVLTQYRPLRLNQHIGIGMPWDLDRNFGGVTVLPPYEKSGSSQWYTGTANAIYQNLEYMEYYNPDYVLILSGDHIYKMDYEVMLD